MKILWVILKYFDVALDKSARLEVLKQLRKDGHDVTFLTGYKREKYLYHLPNNIKFLFSIKKKGLHFLTLNISIFFYSLFSLRKLKPDVVLCCPYSSLSLIPMTFLFKKPKYVLDIRSIPVEINSPLEKLREKIFDFNVHCAKWFFNGISVISPYMRKYIEQKYKIKEEEIGIWSSGVSVKHFNPHRLSTKKLEKLTKALNLDDKFIVMHHGALTPNRGLQDVITAISMLKDNYKDIIFLMVGDGTAKSNLHKLVNFYQVKEYVKVLDAVPYDEVPYYIASCQLGILPFPDITWWRVSNPIKLMEYLAMEKPVIVTDIEAHRDVVVTESCAFYIANNSPLDIKKAIEKAYENKENLPFYGKAGRKIVEDRYTWEAQAHALENYLCKLI